MMDKKVKDLLIISELKDLFQMWEISENFEKLLELWKTNIKAMKDTQLCYEINLKNFTMFWKFSSQNYHQMSQSHIKKAGSLLSSKNCHQMSLV